MNARISSSSISSNTRDCDVRSPELDSALDFLAARGDRTSAHVRAFCAILAHPHPDERARAATREAEAIAARFGIAKTA